MFFGLYKTATLFPVSEQGSEGREMRVISRVLAATVGQNLNISNLNEPVTVVFKPLSTIEEGEVGYLIQVRINLTTHACCVC